MHGSPTASPHPSLSPLSRTEGGARGRGGALGKLKPREITGNIQDQDTAVLNLDLGGDGEGARLCKNSLDHTLRTCAFHLDPLHLHENPTRTTTSNELPAFATFIECPTSSQDPSQTRTQTGPPNIAGGLEGEGNDLPSMPHLPGNRSPPQTRQTDRQGPGRRHASP